VSTLLPRPQVTPADAVPALRWGIVGTSIADRFVAAIHRHTRQRAVAVTARDEERTADFARRHGIAMVHSSLDALLDDPDVGIVYISTPHVLHREQALAAIAAGKHVLIEKPVAMSAHEARDISEAAVAAGRFATEAMWTRYLPQADIIRRVLADGVLGDIRLVAADFGFSIPVMPEHRLWDPALGGGALLDAGVYPISFASSVLGAPTRIAAVGELGPTGVDQRADLMLEHAGGATALLSTSIVTALPTRALIAGSAGRLEVHPPFFGPTGLTLTMTASPDEPVEWTDDSGLTALHDGLAFQATAVAGYIGEGRAESPLHPHDEIVAVMATIDAAREQVGGRVRHPG
jgi:predicted dehydrogenase